MTASANKGQSEMTDQIIVRRTDRARRVLNWVAAMATAADFSATDYWLDRIRSLEGAIVDLKADVDRLKAPRSEPSGG